MAKMQSQAEMTWPHDWADLDIAWFAGLFEGEGCAEIAKNGGTRLTIRMTDRDVIDRVNVLFPCKNIQVVNPKPVQPHYNQPKTHYAWRISKPERVRLVINLMLPYLGERRRAKCLELLAHLGTRPGTGGPNRLKTHCAQGHEYTPANTYIRPGTSHRHCRICMLEWSTEYRARRRLTGLERPFPGME